MIDITLRFGLARIFADRYEQPITIRQILTKDGNRAKLALGLPENATPYVNGVAVSLDHSITASTTVVFEQQAAQKAV